ncbi:MAG TPA: hypothetical protein VGL61_06465 [Kofleriaceae bacterium]|jgi:NifB/MoaA-like Fe-S oxidoreductase
MTDLKMLCLTCAGCSEWPALVNLNGRALCRDCAIEVISIASPRKRPRLYVVPEPEPDPAIAEDRAFDVVKVLFNHGGPLTHDDLKRKIRGKTDILVRAIQVAEGEGWIAANFNGARRAGYQITDKGRTLIRTYGAPEAEPEPEPNRAPTGALAFISAPVQAAA